MAWSYFLSESQIVCFNKKKIKNIISLAQRGILLFSPYEIPGKTPQTVVPQISQEDVPSKVTRIVLCFC